MAAFAELERITGPLEVVHVFQPWDGPEGLWRPTMLEAAAAGGRLVLLTWEPWNRQQGACQTRYTPARIAAGDHDQYICDWARGLASLLVPIYLRPLHEANGNWYPWAAGVPGNTASDLVRAWRRLRSLFADAGADRVRWVWAVNAEDVPFDNRFEECYPGADAVDVLALDGYNWGAGRPEYGGWRTAGEVFDAAYARLARCGRQPVWITEAGCAVTGGDKATWIVDFLRPGRYPRLEAVVWFNVDKEEDWRLTSPPTAGVAFGTSARVSAVGSPSRPARSIWRR